jgi:4-amino-4-deoxy-L-arabinose transferase-like glycosyltransferase
MQNKLAKKPITNSIDYEFEMSGEKFSEIDWSQLRFLKPKNHEIAIAVESSLMKNLWEITSVRELKDSIENNLSFVNFVKIKLDFAEKSRAGYPGVGIWSVFNATETIPLTFSDKLFGWIYYKDKDDKLETFRFIINIDTGEVKYFD